MEAGGQPAAPHVSVILPVHNAEAWLDECLRSVLQQDFEGSMELSVFNDASKDKSMTIIEKWKVKLEDSGILVVIGGHDSPSPRGVGYSKNQAIAQSSGSYLCFLDSIIGCQVRREPPNSTERYTRWINQLASDQLLTQVFTSHGPTVVMPTWFCSREWFSHVGPFDEGGQGVPEDLLFFYSHLRKGGGVVRVDQSLLIYRYHPKAATHSVLERIGDSVLPPEGMSFAGRCGFSTGILCPGRADVHLHGGCHVHCHNRTTIWTHRVRFLEERALPHWAAFTIWNAGRQGRRLYRSLMAESRRKVVAFCDVDENKIKKGFYSYEDSEERPKPRVPILHFRAARPPFVICVKLAARFVVAGYTQQITDMDPRWQNSEENKPHRHPCRSLTLS
ncbi:queuosine-tRNA galactosyltransferase isoform X8 [Equus przewalskii]|uniref:Queuosine-tRNA galactosyltransferase isoform X8 n=1 Tax=Equus przewalskii TaxID=9798 RepID=A0ABM4JN47_EQUPR